jgi:molecular chaperone DnaK
MKLGEAIYKASAEAEGGVPPEGMDEEELRGVDEDIVDADFEDLSDDEKK